MANPFVQYEDDALQELLEGKTDKATKTSITLLKTFCDQTNLNTDLEQISAMQLDLLAMSARTYNQNHT